MTDHDFGPAVDRLIKLPSGAWVTRPAEQVTLAPPPKETP